MAKNLIEDLFRSSQEEEQPDAATVEALLGATQARDQLATKMGVDPAQIQIELEDLGLRLMEGGVVVDIDIHRWTGTKRLAPKELGLEGRTASRAIRLGEKLLMPPTIAKLINSLTTQIRDNLYRYSTRTVWGRWVNALAYPKWRERHDQLVAEFMDVGNSLADNLDKVLAGEGGTWGELRKLYAEHARAVWCRLNHMVVDEYHLEQCPAWFVDEYIQAIFKFMPTAEEIRESFHVEARVSFIPLPSMLEQDQAKQQRVWEEAAEEREASRKRREAQEAMEADVRAYQMSQKKDLIDTFLTDLVGGIQSQIYDVTTRALATMSKNQGRLLEPTMRQLLTFVEWAETMNVTDNAKLEQDTAALRAMIASVDRRDEIKEKLEEMGRSARTMLVNLNVTPDVTDAKLSLDQRDAVLGLRRGQAVDVPELPTLVSKGRRAQQVAVPQL